MNKSPEELQLEFYNSSLNVKPVSEDGLEEELSSYWRDFRIETIKMIEKQNPKYIEKEETSTLSGIELDRAISTF